MWDPKTFDEREIPPMSADMFSTLVISRLRPMKEIEIESGKGLLLHLRVHGRATSAHLERHYERYRANPEALTPVIEQFIQTLVAGKHEELQGNKEFAEIAPKLFPRLLTAQQWLEKRNVGLRLVIRPVVQDLGEALVIERDQELEFVQLDAIPTWGVDASSAYEAASENLERAASKIETSASGIGVEMLLMDHQRDGFAAARALLWSRLEDWQARIQGELVLGLPTHNLLLGFSREHPAFAELRAQVAHDAQHRSDGLFPNLLVVRNGALELLE